MSTTPPHSLAEESQRPLFPHRILDGLSNLGIRVKINLLLLVLGLIPPLASLLLLHQAGHDALQNALALYIAGFLLIFYPMGRAMEELIVLRQTRRINTYVDEVKEGRRTAFFDLPPEKGEEHDFLRLQRNIFWMVQGLLNRETKLQETLRKLETAQRQVLESIEYASRIQRSFLPSPQDLKLALGDHFLFWLPRDGVGGDAYWVKRTCNHTFLAVFDCTGHGVPGAFLTLIVNSLFEQNLDVSCINNPGRLLMKMNHGLKHALSQHGKDTLSDDGLEGAVCCLDHGEHVLHFAGARSLLCLVSDDGVQEVKGDRSGVGFVHVPMDQKFANHATPLAGSHTAYLYTDGITDQIGGGKRLPYGRSRLHAWLKEHAHLPMETQMDKLEQTFNRYKGRNAQRDDITVLGFSLKEEQDGISP